MSLRNDVLAEVDSLLRDAANGAIGAWERANLRKQDYPSRWAAFHGEMSRRLPRWRWAARGWHRARARHWQALADVTPVTASLHRAFPSV